jgi:hypothetical protein
MSTTGQETTTVTPRDFIAEVTDELYRMDAPEWTQPVPIETLVMRTKMILTSITEMRESPAQ